jgi:Fe-S-cluster containining protein
MPDASDDFLDGPEFACGCCGLCCRRDPYYAVSLLDVRNISLGLGMSPADFFRQFCAVVDTPGGFRYPVILAPDGCPFLRDNICRIHVVKPIGCWVFPESALLPVRLLKKSVTAIPTCAIAGLEDDDRPLKADLPLLAARDVHLEHTRKYFEEHDDFEEKPWREATDRLIERLQDADELARRSKELRTRADALVNSLKN